MGMFLRRGKSWKVSVVLDETGTTGFTTKYGYVIVDGVTYTTEASLEQSDLHQHKCHDSFR